MPLSPSRPAIRALILEFLPSPKSKIRDHLVALSNFTNDEKVKSPPISIASSDTYFPCENLSALFAADASAMFAINTININNFDIVFLYIKKYSKYNIRILLYSNLTYEHIMMIHNMKTKMFRLSLQIQI